MLTDRSTFISKHLQSPNSHSWTAGFSANLFQRSTNVGERGLQRGTGIRDWSGMGVGCLPTPAIAKEILDSGHHLARGWFLPGKKPHHPRVVADVDQWIVE